MINIKKSPSKFSKGVPILWGGINLATLNRILKAIVTEWGSEKILENKIEEMLFNSARSAIKSALIAQGIGAGDNVIVSSFTCDAVTHAVLSTGAKVIYVDINDDLTMNEACIVEAINNATRAVIIQNTHGRIGVSPQFFLELRERGIFTIEDNCLSFGSSFGGKNLGAFGDVSVWSMEVSKVVTIGWGGILIVNNKKYYKSCYEFYQKIEYVHFFNDLGRLIQLWLTLVILRLTPPGGYIIWYLLYGLNIFRKSSNDNKALKGDKLKMGTISRLLFNKIKSELSGFFYLTGYNYIKCDDFARSIGINPIIKKNEGELIISPRFSFLVNKNTNKLIEDIALENNIEYGLWFTECPPKYKLSECIVHSCSNAKKIAENIINVPTYWTLSQKDSKKIESFMRSLVRNKLILCR